jgi:DNA-directed RNA polymerase specialized sigma24 family protein
MHKVGLGQVAAIRTREEIAAAIKSFSAADLARLKMVARKYAFGRPIEPEDLLHEAYLGALDSRACPSHVDVVKFLAEAMRSIAHGEAEKVEHKVTLVTIAGLGGSEDEAANIKDEAEDAEAQMMAAQDANRFVAAYTTVIALFDDDPTAQLLLEGMMEEMSAEEMRELTGLDKTAYDSKRKLIRRRIDKQYPEGWKP